MRLPPRPIGNTLHGATDYAVSTVLMTAFPTLARTDGTEAARQIRMVGALQAAYSALTDYPLGVVKVLPFKAHLALDAISAVGLGVTPFATGQFKQGRRHWVPQVALMAFELSAVLMTDPAGEGERPARRR
jgi:hypothetical protein